MGTSLPLTRRFVAATVALLLVAACGSDEPEAATTTSTTTTRPTTTTEAPELVYWVATAKEPSIEVFADPDDDEPERTITDAEATSVPGTTPVVFLATEQAPANQAPEDEWVEVHLPIRPNGSTGWVRTDDVVLTYHQYRIEVEVSEHRLTLYDGDEVVVEEPVGVGREDLPTPGGVYYIKELLQPPNPNGVYGTYAYGLSGFSTVLESFNGGDGVIGIHGTNEPEAIGTDVSAGCIRMHNDVVDKLVEEIGLPLGTPVEIIA